MVFTNSLLYVFGKKTELPKEKSHDVELFFSMFSSYLLRADSCMLPEYMREILRRMIAAEIGYLFDRQICISQKFSRLVYPDLLQVAQGGCVQLLRE